MYQKRIPHNDACHHEMSVHSRADIRGFNVEAVAVSTTYGMNMIVDLLQVCDLGSHLPLPLLDQVEH